MHTLNQIQCVLVLIELVHRQPLRVASPLQQVFHCYARTYLSVMTGKTLKVLVVKTQSHIKLEYPDDIHFFWQNYPDDIQFLLWKYPNDIWWSLRGKTRNVFNHQQIKLHGMPIYQQHTHYNICSLVNGNIMHHIPKIYMTYQETESGTKFK